jgi:predicted AAA+ superfamily ATPase
MLIERKPYMQILRDFKDEHIIKVISGVRRCGKSTLLEMFADELRKTVSEEEIQFYNFEDLDVLSIGDYRQIYDHIKVKIIPGKMNYIFLDEVQNIKTFERLVDSLYIKKNVDLYVTGSNAYLLSGELATLLTGRYIEISILPFSFAEYCELYLNSPNLTNIAGLANKSQNPPNLSKTELLGNFIYDGGLPQATDFGGKNPEQSDAFIRSILNSVLEKDIFSRHTIHNRQAFNKVLDFVLDSVGSIISPRSIADTLRINDLIVDKQTVVNYLNYLAESFLLYKIPRYDLKGKSLLQTLEKYYLADNGFRKARLGKRFEEDRGHLLENAVYLELRRRNREVFIGKLRDKEVDFVTIDHKGYISYYQVAYIVTDKLTLERELAPLKAIRDSNPKFLLTTDIDINPVYDGIRKLNVADWLLVNEKSR